MFLCCCADANPAESTVIAAKAHDESGTRPPPLEPKAEDMEAEPPVHAKADTGKLIGPPLGKSQKEDRFGSDTRFTIKIQKSASAQVGLEVSRYHGTSILIKRVKDKGLVHQWNEEHPGREVLAYDIIVEVNGVSGRADDILAIIAKETVLECVIVRSGTVLPQAG